jgi:hypothetical protein
MESIWDRRRVDRFPWSGPGGAPEQRPIRCLLALKASGVSGSAACST